MASASDLVDDIRRCLQPHTSFRDDLKAALAKRTLEELQRGKVNDASFERLVQAVLVTWGATDARVIGRSQDEGADVVAVVHFAGCIELRVAVQAKHWRPHPPVSADVVRQLAQGMEATQADIGLVVTTGTIGQDAREEVERLAAEHPELRYGLVDGEALARSIVDAGLNTLRD